MSDAATAAAPEPTPALDRFAESVERPALPARRSSPSAIVPYARRQAHRPEQRQGGGFDFFGTQGGHGGARRAAPRHLQHLVFAHHVAEARGEAGEGHGPDLPGVGRDHAVGSEAAQLPHLGQVFAVVHGVDDHELAVPLRGGGELQLEQPRGNPPR